MDNNSGGGAEDEDSGDEVARYDGYDNGAMANPNPTSLRHVDDGYDDVRARRQL